MEIYRQDRWDKCNQRVNSTMFRYLYIIKVWLILVLWYFHSTWLQLFVNFAEGQGDGTTPEPDYDLSPEDGATGKYGYVNRSYDTQSDSAQPRPTPNYKANIKGNTGSLRLRPSLDALSNEGDAAPAKDSPLALIAPEGHILGEPMRTGAPLRHVPPLARADELDTSHEVQPTNAHPKEGEIVVGVYDGVAGVPEMEYIPTESISVRL